MAIASWALDRPHAPAFIAAETGSVLSFGDLDQASRQLARLLRSRLNVGDRFALLLDNGPGYFVASWAGRRAGLRFVPVNWHLGVEEAAYIVDNSDSRALIASPRLAELAQSLADRTPNLDLLLSDGGAFGRFAPLAEAVADWSSDPLEPELEGSFMLYSSGTTGKPKGILRPLTEANFGAPNGLEMLMSAFFEFDDRSRFYSPAPLYHAAPLGWTMGAQALGGCAIVAERFDAEATLRHIETHRVTHAQFVPTHFVRMLKLPEAVRARYDVSSLRMVVHSAAPCPVEVKERMLEWWGPIIHEYYGQSEGAGFTRVTPQEWSARKGTVGRVAAGAIHIVDDAGAELGPGEIGHILFEGAPRFEYHKEPGQTARFFDERGRSRPGDMGWVDEDGYLFLADRASNVIISGGVNISPQEIEAVLALHPAVRDVAVIGVPDPDFGEQVKAVVELAPGAAGQSALTEELDALCRAHLASFKCPKSFDYIDELPRLPSGKLLKRDLKRRYWPEGRMI